MSVVNETVAEARDRLRTDQTMRFKEFAQRTADSMRTSLQTVSVFLRIFIDVFGILSLTDS